MAVDLWRAPARSAVGCALVLGVLLLAGCTAAQPRGVAGPEVTSAQPAPPVVSTPAMPGSGPIAGTLVAGDADNGHTVTLTLGKRLVVQLSGTYWRFGGLTAPTALRVDGHPVTIAPAPGASGCVPHLGCGTVTATFHAATAGRAVVTARRTACGEATRCTGSQSGYRLFVVVR
ncbi:MAG TPA: hypothetical protein VLJ59_00640 [Mycobacteriales bacterium]|nr:hypothetical protein [Mycobacteriales bacterium]